MTSPNCGGVAIILNGSIGSTVVEGGVVGCLRSPPRENRDKTRQPNNNLTIEGNDYLLVRFKSKQHLYVKKQIATMLIPP